MSLADRYARWDAAYVLGALSASERQEYEEHLAQCRGCRDAVAELAGMPGLLTRVPTGDLLAMEDRLEGDLLAAQPPPSLMPVLPHEHRRWGQHVLVPAAVAASLVVGGLGGYALSEAGTGPERVPAATTTSGPTRLAFTPVDSSWMTAVVDVVPQESGTELRVECQYATSGPGADPKGAWAEYAIWVVDRQGHAELRKSWTAKPDRLMRPTAASSLSPREIAAVEIRRVDTGETVMRARLI
jgi:hypothetical protein